ncbi:hypothetical protein M0R04_07160 [Candidatus Dojkabacteria bacterium]|jgi:hypothetical protein|nr:hypothetical protein [Candidatus Dojkabacteria bacterium]
MKLIELFEAIDWNTKSEKQQIAMLVGGMGYKISSIKNPSEAVQLAAINLNAWNITYINRPTHTVIKLALSNLCTYSNNKDGYDMLVTKLFKDNTLLARKWIRYGNTMRKS